MNTTLCTKARISPPFAPRTAASQALLRVPAEYFVMPVRIWLEVGHSCGPRSTPRGHAKVLDWRLWVRGANGRDISAFVHKVVFIYVLLARLFTLKECMSINVEKPSKLLWKALIAAGGEAVEHTNRKHRNDRLVITPETHSGPPLSRHQLVEPVQCKHVLRIPSPYALDDTCIKCGESQIELIKELRMANMTEYKIDHAAQLYVSFFDYEKHLDAITLQPFSDPIFNIPELPASLQEMLKNVGIKKPEL
ncbi:unnamed protein product [Diatraea saccharalis]|uniref:Uncharacterized protein n=1 Tax=Diatraea saccharalis TaxID=40085 RepID=A0A9N9WE28_9NEOP|nr:unnamed protein product [Diatraea saccharalis]